MKIAILGATGLVGRKMLSLLSEQDWVTEAPLLLASPRSAGASQTFRGTELVCQAVAAEHFEAVDLALFSAGGDPSRHWGPIATAKGAWVVDNSSAWRMDEETPLVVPEINGALVREIKNGPAQIIANPNCSTIQIVQAVAPIDREFRVNEVQVTTLQAVSGAGQSAVAELTQQNEGADRQAASSFPRTMAHNVVPAIGAAAPAGMFEEEEKVVQEMRKIMSRRNDLKVSCTAVRVPVYNGHSAAVRVVCDRPVDLETAHNVLSNWPGVIAEKDPHQFLTPLEMSGRHEVHVGRVRRDPDNPHALLMWVVADNLLKGAALNAVQIAALIAAED
ncbi:MAG: aspartate-semialdehyde dehydrogenase [Candidatus Krumholzibacteriia bacterium]|jgi:aspartate-semialdehyde dehydrogenase